MASVGEQLLQPRAEGVGCGEGTRKLCGADLYRPTPAVGHSCLCEYLPRCLISDARDGYGDQCFYFILETAPL